MITLNEPSEAQEPRDEQEWTPAIGLRRGATHGLVTAAILILAFIPLAHWLPLFFVVMWLRVPLAFGVVWLLLKLVQRGAGMVDRRCTVLAVGLGILVLLSNHIVFALLGVPDCSDIPGWWIFPINALDALIPVHDGLMIGWNWCHPYALLALNSLPVALGGGACIAMSDEA